MGVGDGAAPALGLEAVCLEPFVTSHTSHKGLSTRMRPVPCAHPPQLPVTIWETLSVPLTFAPIHSPTYLFSKIFSPDAVLALGNLQASGPALLPVHPLLRTFFFSSCLCNADPPSPDTLPHPRPHYSTLNSWVVGVPRSEN